MTKQEEAEVLKVYDTWLHSYLNGDVKTYDSYFDDAFHFIGSTNNEEFLNRKETTDFFDATAEQLSGKSELRNETKIVEQFGELVFITHLFDAWFKYGKDWSFYSRFRFTNALKKNNEGWRFIYQHYSTPDSKAQEGETIGFDKITAENLQLREAIQRRTKELEEKNRELEIEGALQRIRAQAVAMKESTDLLDIVVTMRTEFTNLGHEAHYFWHMMWLPDTYEKAMTSGDGTKIGFVMELPRHIHGDIPFLAKWEKSKKATVIYPMSAEQAIAYVDKMVALGDFENIDPQAPTHDDITHIGGLTFIMARTSHGEIGYSLPGVVKTPPKADMEILVKFAGAFDLAHRRFLDLQKTEKQAREVQIELALEKVRSRTMAMKHSDELQEASFLLDQQVRALGINTWGCAFNIYGENESTEWFGNEAGVLPTYSVPRTGIFKEYYDKGQKGETLWIQEFSGEACTAHYETMSALPVIGDVLLQLKETNNGFPTYQIDHVVFFKYGYLLFITKEHIPDAHEIFKRFAKVFEQTYTRFLDLQKAEAQAREAEIQLALERVRARTMAMHNSDEFKDVIQVIFDQFVQLNIHIEHAGFILDYNNNKDMHIWLADQHAVFPEITLPYFDCAHWNSFNKAKKKGQRFFANQLGFDEKNKFYNDLFEFIPDLPEDTKKTYLKFDGLAISTVLLESIGLYIENFSGIPFTAEENTALMRFGKVFQQTYTRFIDLQKAEARAREAQIENALEKVRSRTMAMQKSEELPLAANDLFLQVQELGIPAWSAGYCIWQNEKHNASCNMSSEGEIQKGFILPSIGEGYDFYTPQKNGETFHVKELGGEALVKHYEFMMELPNVGSILKELKDAGLELPTFQIFHICYFKYGYVMFITYEAVPDSHDIFKRFGKVFEQTYTRFLDLQKAEAQAREAQIEAALERIRSRSMGMQKSEDLAEVVRQTKKEIIALGIQVDNTQIATDFTSDPYDGLNDWISVEEKRYLEKFHIPFIEHPVTAKFYETLQNNRGYFKMKFSKAEKNAYFKLLFEQSDFKNTPEERQNYVYSTPGWVVCGVISIKSSMQFARYNLEMFSHEEVNVFKRFGNVFEQAYTRFLDLQKAEAQAREAQIEAALERVRSRAMAMRNSEDIMEATMILFKEIEKLEIKTMRCGILIIHQNKVMDVWTTSTTKNDKIIQVTGQIDMTTHPLFKKVYNSWKAKEVYAGYELKGQDAENYYKVLTKEGNYKLPNSSVIKGKHHNTWFNFNEGALFVFTKNEMYQETLKIFQRFAKVFGLTYQRYRELIEFEKREKEAKKQASLDRVRGEIASMRTTEDLDRITPIIWQELTNLGVPFFRCGVFIMNEEKENIEVYLSDPNGKSLGLMNLNYTASTLTKDSVAAWRKNSVFKAHWSKKEFIDWTKSLMDLGKIKTKKGYQGGDNAPESLDLHFVPFSQGMLYVGNLKPLTEDQIRLVKNLAESFSIAYSRYEDFAKLEKAKKSIESTLTELQTTQAQLIQSEKMASLGELTAGIAHEIQNPLNFVNNFSEVSKELLEEMQEEIEKGDFEEVKAIMDDVIQNLKKINHHGKRADGIVKGMLQHSRSSSGTKEPTDINVLADEYLRLAYHGLRAKDKSFNAELVTDFDNTIGKINVIPQDIGRVILNLITNGFHAANERKKESEGSSFMPTVSVGTKKGKDTIAITVTDNGKGIPKSIIDKIFQPFFTTKPTGEGTGLGLSMSYDIVTKGHGGELKVKSKEGEGTTFYIILPMTKLP
ncbi:ATP-binding protein [Maribacter sp. PR1]|uniref:histidine kinase n=1 Tax=Maribacter cobaltidurans TaxID=1178778 RepID=A0ABU7IV82_9FLAO|nr:MULTISPECIES: ATP-binding protein [Maribacter]MDC6389396.1 ATP-binding protein [Maribacter sp. PR1]MEE1976785.1 ATP-binding protein [Maribacter cobaltidurans]